MWRWRWLWGACVRSFGAFSNTGPECQDEVPGRGDPVSVTTKRIRAIEFHRFFARGRWLLFDVVAMEVIPSTELDDAILSAAQDYISEEQLLAAVAADGVKPDAVAERIASLREQRFLLREG